MHRNEVRRISEGGMMVALVGVILFFNRQSAGILESVFYWVLSFPILIYTCRYGLKWGCIVSVAMMVISFILSAPTTMFYLFSSLVIGVVYGEGVRRRWPNRWLLGLTFLFTFCSYLITMFVFAEIFGYNIEVEMSEVASMLSGLMQMSGASLVVEMRHAVLIIVLFANILNVVLQSLCIHLISFVLLRRLKIEMNPVKTVFDLRLSKGLGWVLLLSLLVSVFFVRFIDVESVKVILLSVMICISLFMVGYGLTVVMCRLTTTRTKAVLILMALALIPLAWPFLIILAFADSQFDLKRVKKR